METKHAYTPMSSVPLVKPATWFLTYMIVRTFSSTLEVVAGEASSSNIGRKSAERKTRLRGFTGRSVNRILTDVGHVGGNDEAKGTEGIDRYDEKEDDMHSDSSVSFGTELVGLRGSDRKIVISGIDFDSGEGDSLGGHGEDTLVGGRGDDTLVGGLGEDTIVSGHGEDTLPGSDNKDAVYVRGDRLGNDSLNGGDGNDTIDVANKSTLPSRLGNDSLYGGDGNDTLDGGTGNDIIKSKVLSEPVEGNEDVTSSGVLIISACEGENCDQEDQATLENSFQESYLCQVDCSQDCITFNDKLVCPDGLIVRRDCGDRSC